MTSFLLLGLGLFLVFLEFFLPGGILGILGSFLVIGSIILFAFQSNSALYSVLYALAAITLLMFLFRFALWRISHSDMYSTEDQAGFVASSYDKALIGQEGVVDSDLKPGGHVLIGDKRHLAISLTGYIPKGDKVLVVGGEGESLKVKNL